MSLGLWQINVFPYSWGWGNHLRKIVVNHPAYAGVFAFWWKIGPIDIRRFVR